MKKHSLKLALLGSTLVASSLLAGPAFAGDPDCGAANVIENHCIAAIWTKSGDVLVEITDGGVTQRIYCHHGLKIDQEEIDDRDVHVVDDGEPMLRKEAFTVCVGGNFAAGNNGNEMLNLSPSLGPLSLKNPSKFGIPFISIRGKVTYLESNGEWFECDNGDIVPLYRLDKQDLDNDPSTKGDVKPLPLGTIVNILTENAANGGCIGVRTTFMFQVGTCKIWKVRKYFNGCSSAKTITQIKEFEQVADEMNLAGQSAGPGGSLTAVGQEDDEDHYISLSTGNTGANPGNASTPLYQRSAAGSVGPDPFENTEFCACRLMTDPLDEDSFTRDQVERDDHSWLELFLSYFPGGVKLQPKGKAGSEKFITFHIDVQ